MDINTWIVFATSYLVITLSPGPNVMLVLQNVLKYGYRAGLTSIVANLCCQLGIVCLVGFGAGAMILKFPFLFFMLKILGGGYLIFLGLSCFKKNENDVSRKVTQESADRGAFLSLFKAGCLVSLSNPKTVLFLSAFLPQFLNHSELVIPQFIIMFLTMSACVLSVHLVYSYFAVSVKNKLVVNSSKQSAILRLKVWLNRVTGGAFILLGGGIIASQR